MPRHTRRALFRLGAGLAAAALLPACGDDEPPPPREERPPSEPVPELELRRRSRLRESDAAGVLRLGTTDPAASIGLGHAARLLSHSRLVSVDPRTARVHGDLATDLETPEPLVVRFRLHGQARFHPDASGIALPLTADTVQQDFERRLGEGVPLFRDVVERVEAPDGRTVVLHLRGPFAFLFEGLASVEASIRGPGRYLEFAELLGSGPFAPAARHGEAIVLARNPLYHEDNYPRLEAVTLQPFADPRAWAADFAAGSVDVWAGGVADVLEPPAREGAARLERPERRLRGLGLSLLPRRGAAEVRHVAAFQDRRVREAVARSLDRPALLAFDRSRTSGPVGPAHAADALPPDELAAHRTYERDLGEAQALLEAADGTALVFRIQVPETARMREFGQLVVEQLLAGGFAPQLVPVAPAEWERNFLAGDFESTVFEVGGLDTPDVGLRLHTAGGIDGRFSLWGYSNPLYDSAVREALSALNPAERAVRSRDAQRMLLDDVPAMFPVAAPVEQAYLSPRLLGYEFDAYDFNAAWLASSWQMRDAT